MFKTIGGLFRRQDQESLIKEYTKDLASITSKIHQLDQSLKRKDVTQSKWQRRLNLHGMSAIVLLNAVNYIQIGSRQIFALYAVLSIAFFILLKWLLRCWFNFSNERTIKKLDQLKVDHQEKLENLKQKTHFYSTNSLIQRFSSGEQQSEDAITLMDEEMKNKHEELDKLQKELENLKKQGDSSESQEQREKWFDKVLGVLSGGDIQLDRQIKPIVCAECGKSTGCYTVLGAPLKYVCPLCGWKFDSNEIDSTEEDKKRATDKKQLDISNPTYN
ncbi:LAFE_0A01178g1_1 [Lachancea fermentati]|uniref:Endoplasmic reticulum junction formation protein lunapark n=1 Tax=Lachancea fermentati TaxID=4955 RepID=A0A1G4M6A4_LACFM|nr:LAFE_0A01178g1_1 [Lachancea fermentati]